MRSTVHDVAMIVGVFVCEVTAVLSIAIQKRPGLGLVFVGAGLAIASSWARKHRRRADAVARDEIDSAKKLLAEGSHTAAWNAACAVAQAGGGRRLRHEALAVLVRVALAERRPETAREILGRMQPRWLVDPCLEAAIERAEGHADRAAEALERARRRPTFDGAAARLLVELHAEANHLDRAVGIAVEYLDLLETHDVRNMIAWLETWGEPHQASAVATAQTLRSAAAEREVRFPNRLAS